MTPQSDDARRHGSNLCSNLYSWAWIALVLVLGGACSEGDREANVQQAQEIPQVAPVLTPLPILRPITATASVDLGNNTNWDFQGGGFVTALRGSALGDGNGNIDRVQIYFSGGEAISATSAMLAAYPSAPISAAVSSRSAPAVRAVASSPVYSGALAPLVRSPSLYVQPWPSAIRSAYRNVMAASS